MGKHVNHQDAQDRLIVSNSRLTRTKSGSIQEKDPATLTITEQAALIKAKRKAESEKKYIPPVKYLRISHYK